MQSALNKCVEVNERTDNPLHFPNRLRSREDFRPAQARVTSPVFVVKCSWFAEGLNDSPSAPRGSMRT